MILAETAIGLRTRVSAGGKFLFADREKFYVRGVSYGTFAPTAEWGDYPPPDVVEQDFEQMAAAGMNVVRVYTAPPQRLLDAAEANGMRVLVGLGWEQHIAFLDDPGRAAAIEASVRDGVRACAGHPAVLAFAIGNEIPSPIVRWHGPKRVEQFLERLYRAAKSEDPEALVTYVNYPSTEYLRLPFLDLVCFNVFLEDEERLEAYLERLHSLAGDRPVVITELGLDSLRHGVDEQASSLRSQLRTAFRSGCAGAVVFSWTDEWHRGGFAIEDWCFGLTDRDRRPKPALAAVGGAFSDGPRAGHDEWPRVSVVVCTHNGSRTLADCLAGIEALDYPDFEVIVVDDGSTDSSAQVAECFGVRLIRTANRGLSSARNAGLSAATGEIVAYLDDDCRPDPDWLTYLVGTMTRNDCCGAGGPNIAPDGDGTAAAAVARAPGGPMHVLISDREAEHIPGCNMAFWRRRLLEIGGFDAQFHAAGDDVDICWRLRDRGGALLFSPAAMVWHHARNSVRGYFRQQRGYGRAEALLERKWPEKYNRGGHLTWSGRVYGPSVIRPRRWRVYYGTWGSGLFQSIYERTPGLLTSLPLMPEWYLLIAVLAAFAGFGLVIEPVLFVVPLMGLPLEVVLLGLALAALLGRATYSAWGALGGWGDRRPTMLALTTLLHLLQPLARLLGRLGYGLTPWRRRGPPVFALPRPRVAVLWSDEWVEPDARLRRLEARLQAQSTGLLRGGAFDRWDLMIRSGPLGAARFRMAVEEHGGGKQLVRFRIWPRFSRGGALLALILTALAALAAGRGGLVTTSILGGLALLVVLRMLYESAVAVSLLQQAIAAEEEEPRDIADVLRWEGPEHVDESLEPARLSR